MSGAGGNINRDNPVHTAAVPTILYQRALHQTNQFGAIRGDCETFHPLISNSARGIAADLRGTKWTQVGDRQITW